MEKVLYQELLPHELVERVNACPIAYLPLGTLEWHSFHLPYGVDMLTPLGAFMYLAERVGGVVLPPLFLGTDGELEHNGKFFYGMDFVSFEEGYPQHLIGSMHYIPEQLYLQIIEQIIKNLKRNGFALLVAVGHGPSTGTLLQNRERLENEFDFKILSLTELCGEGPEGMAMDHAAFNETALMMSLYPELVDLSLLNDDVPPVGVWGKDPRVPGIKEEGDRLTVLYGEQASEKLIEINKSLPKPNLRLEFRHVKNLME